MKFQWLPPQLLGRRQYKRLVEQARCGNPHIRAVAAAHPKAPIGLLEILAEDDHVLVRRAVAMNPNTPREILTELRQDWDEGIAFYARWRLQNP